MYGVCLLCWYVGWLDFGGEEVGFKGWFYDLEWGWFFKCGGGFGVFVVCLCSGVSGVLCGVWLVVVGL